MKSFIAAALLLLTLALPAAFARGEAACQPEALKQGAIDELEALRRDGIETIDGKSIDFIEETIRQTTIIAVPRVNWLGNLPGAKRETARFNAKTKTIEVSEEHCSYVGPDSHKNVLLHEFFGIAGVRDNNFGKTAAISNLRVFKIIHAARPDLTDDPSTVEHLKNQIIKVAGGGGVTGVEGGGDVSIEDYAYMLYKRAMLLLLRREISGKTYELLCETLDHFNIEFSSELMQGDMKVIIERFTIVIPNNPMGTVENERLNRARINQFFDDLLSGRFRSSLPSAHASADPARSR
jgi:hypothetical protein